MEPEVIEIGSNSGFKSTNFGSGIELLMNDKKKGTGDRGNSDNIRIDDLDNLADELNDLVDIDVKPIPFDLGNDVEPLTVSFDEIDSSKIPQAPTIGEATRNANENVKTWDGFAQFDEIPVTPNMTLPSGPKLTK